MAIFNRETLVPELRGTRIALIPDAYLSDKSAISDDLIWAKAQSAALAVQRYLGVPLQPTHFYSDEPSDDEKAALNGAPYVVEPGYDMPPDFFSVSTWGALNLRVRPVISVSEVRFVYPSINGTVFTVPKEWIRIDAKYGSLRFFPSAQPLSAPLSVFTLQAMASGTTVPHMIRVKYVAGIDVNQPDYADVLDAVKRMIILKILTECYIPQSGSISADGLSQSVSADTAKFEEALYGTLDTLRQQIIGPVWGVL